MEEIKYFISYAAYSNKNVEVKIDFFNDIIYINEDITTDLINKIQYSLIDKLNEGSNFNSYFATQIINIIRL